MAPCPSPFHCHGGRHARHLRRVLPRRDERPSRGRPDQRLQRRDAGSRRWNPTNTCKHCLGCLQAIKTRRVLTVLKWGRRVLYVRVLLQVTMCPRSRGRASSFAGAPIVQFEDVALQTQLCAPGGPGLLRLEGGGAGCRPECSRLCRGRRRGIKAPGTLQYYQ